MQTITTEKRGVVVSLHIHPDNADHEMVSVESFHLEAGKGIVDDGRYYDRSSRRHITLIEREVLAHHESLFDQLMLYPGRVRSNIETSGINLSELLGKRVRVGSALIDFYEARLPCSKMDSICVGLRATMENNRQGMIGFVVENGTIRINDPITALASS